MNSRQGCFMPDKCSYKYYTKWLPKELGPSNVHLENNDQSGYQKWLPKELGKKMFIGLNFKKVALMCAV